MLEVMGTTEAMGELAASIACRFLLLEGKGVRAAMGGMFSDFVD